jgi:hypothetical protein
MNFSSIDMPVIYLLQMPKADPAAAWPLAMPNLLTTQPRSCRPSQVIEFRCRTPLLSESSTRLFL